MKALAVEINVPVIVFSQLTRTEETRKNYQPTILDLPQYNPIRRNASAIMFLNRPEYNNINFDENGISTNGIMELIIEKQNDEFCCDNIVKLKYMEHCFSDCLDYSNSEKKEK